MQHHKRILLYYPGGVVVVVDTGSRSVIAQRGVQYLAGPGKVGASILHPTLRFRALHTQ